MSILADPKSTYTPEDLLAMPNGIDYELVNGQLVERHMGQQSCRIGGRIFRFLDIFSEQNDLGWVYPADATYQCFPDAPLKVRKMDVSFIRKERQSVLDEPLGHSRIAPDLAVEVLSPNDLVYDVDEKVLDYHSAGVSLIWIVHPRLRMVVVHRIDGTSSVLHENDELSGENVVPGFRCPVRDIFLPPVSAAATS